MEKQTGGLRALRQEKMLTQQELAAKADLTITTVSGIETGKVNPSFRTIRALAKALSCSPQGLKRLLENNVQKQGRA